MKIGIDLRSLGEGSIHRGIGTNVNKLLWSLSLVDKTNDYYLFADSGQSEYFLENLPHSKNFNYVFLKPSTFRKKKFIRTVAIANPALKIDGYDLNVFYQLDTLFPIKSSNTPIVTIIYDLIPQIYKDQYMKLTLHNKSLVGIIVLLKDIRRHQLINKSLALHRKSDRVISISECTKRDLVKMFNVDERRITTILLGADKISNPNKSEKDTREIKELTKKPFILYIGGSDPRKGLLSLIDDYVKIEKSHKINLVIGGKELTDPRVVESRKIRNKIENLSLSDKVLLPGFVSDAELQYLYSNALAFVFPSRYEGFGLPILEAMQASCPVICYDNSSIPEVAGKAALMVPDGESMVPAIESLIENQKLRATLIKDGLKQAQKFTWEKTAKETLKVLMDVAK